MKRLALLLCLSPLAFGDQITIPNPLTNNTVADADHVQQNFEVLTNQSNENDDRIGVLEELIRADEVTLNFALGDGLKNTVPYEPQSWSGTGNTAGGLRSLMSNFRGGENTSFGAEALASNVSGSWNTAIGFRSLFSNEDGGRNVAVGARALQDNIGGDNTAVGYEALFESKRGGGNEAFGWKALYSLFDGSQNSALGSGALYRLVSGNNNVAVGFAALETNATGWWNTGIGAETDTTAKDLKNATAIGYLAHVEASHTVQIGNHVITDVYLGRREGATNYPYSPLLEAPPADANLHLRGKIRSGAITYPNTHGSNGQVLGTTGSGELVWVGTDDIIAQHTQELEEQVASLQEQLKSQQEELLAIVQSQQEQMTMQQEQIAQLQRMVEHQFAAR